LIQNPDNNMQFRHAFYICMMISGLLASNMVRAQYTHLPSKDTLLKQMVTANRYFMDKWPDPGKDIVTDKVRPSNLWTRATYYEGLMALYYTKADEAYYQYAVDWGESHDWMPTYGPGNLMTRDGDHQCCGQTYIELYQLAPENTDWIGPITTCINYRVESELVDDWSWIDAIQMAMPVYAKLGVVHEDTSYYHKMHEMYMFTRNQHGSNGLYDTEDHLWYRDGDFDPPAMTPNDKKIYWSRGNGWVIAALVRVLDVIPDTLEYKEEYLTTFKEMAAALIAVQREDGFWNASLADPEHFGGRETSGTGFFTYGLAWGINNGHLDSATYMPHVVKGWNGMAYEALHPDGFLGYVQSTGKQPSDGYPFEYDKPANFEDYGLGAFLLAGSEVYKLASDTASLPAFNPQEPVGLEPPETSGSEVIVTGIYPNPASDALTLTHNTGVPGEMEVRLLNGAGELVGRRTFAVSSGPDHSRYDLSGLPDGVYVAVIQLGNRKQTIKFMKS